MITPDELKKLIQEAYLQGFTDALSLISRNMNEVIEDLKEAQKLTKEDINGQAAAKQSNP